MAIRVEIKKTPSEERTIFLRIRLNFFIIVIIINALAPSGPCAKNVYKTFSWRSVLWRRGSYGWLL